MKCPYCGSEHIEEHISWGKTIDTGCVGLRYTRGTLWTGIAQVYSDLCLDCGAIVRSYIQEDTKKEWSHDAGSRYTR
ncbi:MAG: hypothetical protein IJM20_01350 [Clostridia bacterium]|jgi:DNA-directed RNA polymerase subunit RPC12/RpoP|nr:hypothetical protein [Clostridia bacterium]